MFILTREVSGEGTKQCFIVTMKTVEDVDGKGNFNIVTNLSSIITYWTVCSVASTRTNVTII
jgi:hypothetical protein